jgi:hypothetical protein
VKIVHVVQGRHDENTPPPEPQRILLGTLKLSEAEVTGLDELMAFYRSKHRGGCTTIDTITVTQKAANGDTVTASFTDSTCATHKMENVTTLPSLAAKLKQSAK